jgi:hypothetical protein
VSPVDAVRAAREALASEQLIHPRRRGEREALRVLLATRQSAVASCTAAINHLKALIVSAPDDLRAQIRALSSKAQITYCAKLRDRPAQSLEHRMTDCHRLDQGGDRQLNRALHTIVLGRTRVDPETKAYITRRAREGKSVREARRCLKRAIARRLFKILERNAKPPTAIGPSPASTAA